MERWLSVIFSISASQQAFCSENHYSHFMDEKTGVQMGPLPTVKSKNIDTQLCLTVRSSVCAMLPLNFLVWQKFNWVWADGKVGKKWSVQGQMTFVLSKCLLNLWPL